MPPPWYPTAYLRAPLADRLEGGVLLLFLRSKFETEERPSQGEVVHSIFPGALTPRDSPVSWLEPFPVLLL